MGWFFSLIDISPATANRFYTFGWAASLSGAAITFVGVVFLMWGTRVRDIDFEENIAGLHTKAGVFEKDAADARKQTAELQKETAGIQLNLEQERIARLQLEEKHAMLQKLQTARRLTESHKAALVAALHPFHGQQMTIRSVIGSDDGAEYAKDFFEVFLAAGWKIPDGLMTSAYDQTPVGLEPTINPAHAEGKRYFPAYLALINVLGNLGLMAPNEAFINPEVAVGTIDFRVGIRPPIR